MKDRDSLLPTKRALRGLAEAEGGYEGDSVVGSVVSTSVGSIGGSQVDEVFASLICTQRQHGSLWRPLTEESGDDACSGYGRSVLGRPKQNLLADTASTSSLVSEASGHQAAFSSETRATPFLANEQSCSSQAWPDADDGSCTNASSSQAYGRVAEGGFSQLIDEETDPPLTRKRLLPHFNHKQRLPPTSALRTCNRTPSVASSAVSSAIPSTAYFKQAAAARTSSISRHSGHTSTWQQLHPFDDYDGNDGNEPAVPSEAAAAALACCASPLTPPSIPPSKSPATVPAPPTSQRMVSSGGHSCVVPARVASHVHLTDVGVPQGWADVALEDDDDNDSETIVEQRSLLPHSTHAPRGGAGGSSDAPMAPFERSARGHASVRSLPVVFGAGARDAPPDEEEELMHKVAALQSQQAAQLREIQEIAKDMVYETGKGERSELQLLQQSQARQLRLLQLEQAYQTQGLLVEQQQQQLALLQRQTKVRSLRAASKLCCVIM